MVEIQEKEIDGLKVSISQLPAMRAWKLLNRIGRALGPAFSQLAGMQDASKLSGAVTALFTSLSEEEQEALTRALLVTCKVNGVDVMPTFDITMRGRMPTVFKILKFAFEVNYGNFSVEVASLLQDQKMAAFGSAPAPTSSTIGPSGG